MNFGWLYINGHKYRYATMGSGKPLFMINGIGANIETWTPLAQELSKDRELIMFDYAGCGRTKPHFFPKNMSSIADEVMRIAILGFGLDAFDVLGYSFGGAVAQEISHKYPEYLERLVLVSTTPGLEGKLPEPTVLSMAANPLRYYSTRYAKTIAPFIHGNTDGEDELMRNMMIPNPIGFRNQLFAIAQWGMGVRPVNETHRTLIISGNKDPLIPHKNSLVLSSKFKRSELNVVSGAGHLWLLSEPRDSSKMILRFLEDSN